MIQLLPVDDQELINRLNKAYHTTATHAYACIEKKEIKATLLYTINREKATIHNVSTVEEDLFDGLVRACFASLIDKGIDQAEFDKCVDLQMLQKLGFVQGNTFSTESLTEIIDNCRKCKKEGI